MIAAEYAIGCKRVNALSCLSKNNQGSKTQNMTLGERLKAARLYAKMDTQGKLAKASGVSQQSISKIESGLVDSSGYVVHLAKACGVRPEWLAMEDGEMLKTEDKLVDALTDPKIRAAVELMMSMSSGQKSETLAASNTLAQPPAPRTTGTR